MKIKSLQLENIRSYTNQKIEFPSGSLLLSGDIGSGKSSILLAMDFALFGLTRGILSGGALLRSGENRGSVTLNFEIEDRDIIIKRNLKRSDSSITQDSGYILIDGVKKEQTATELKQTILQLLNYPQELLTKSKSLIYRYTVYTPQEEMKQILLGDPELRLDALRKVFGIDRYKRIKENSTLFLKYLRSRKREIATLTADLFDKEEEKNKKLKSLEELNNYLIGQSKPLENIITKINSKKEELKKIEEQIKTFNELKKESDLTSLNIKNIEGRISDNNLSMSNLVEQITVIKQELEKEKIHDLELLETQINNKKSSLESLENSLKEISSNLLEHELKEKNSLELKQKVLELDNCPTCKQEVSPTHKRNITEMEERKMLIARTKIKEFSELGFNKNKDLDFLKKELERLQNEKQRVSIIQIKKQNLEEKEKLYQDLNNSQEILKRELQGLILKKEELNKKIDEYKNTEEEYSFLTTELDQLINNQKLLEIKKAEIEKEISMLKEIISSIEKDILKKQKLTKAIEKISKLQTWLETSFNPLMDTMEKQIMFKVHHDFNSLFQNWFEILVDEPLLKIRLSEDFSPIIEQNGYDLDYINLSGGEKTAAALSYRLALNQVINDLIVSIKTKDLIILDEPTDGFSSEQLDRMRLVLDNLNISQIIIVSHESKIESFVDHVIRFTKEEHVSSIV